MASNVPLDSDDSLFTPMVVFGVIAALILLIGVWTALGATSTVPTVEPSGALPLAQLA